MTNAAAISRLLKREFGITTLPDHHREGYRASNSGPAFTPGVKRIPMVYNCRDMKLRYNYRIYPSPGQVINLNQAFGCARVVYNLGLNERKAAYQQQLPFITDAQLSKRLTAWKKQPEFSWLNDVSSVALQQALGDLNTAYRNFFAGLKGKRANGQILGPPSKRKKATAQAVRFTKNAQFKILPNGRLRVPKVGDLEVRWSRELPSDPSSVTVLRDATGKYHVSFVVDITDEPLPELSTEVGIDLGLSTYAVLSDGRRVESPKFFRQAERRIRRANRVLSRREKGSANRRKARLKLAKVHAKVRQQRTHFIENETTRIVRENQAVYVETLDLVEMGSKKNRRGKSVHDQALGQFTRVLGSKCERYGRVFVKVDQWFPSTQMCSHCESLTGPKGDRELRVRSWTCSRCGVTHDRDVNAAVNVLAAGRAERLNASHVSGQHVSVGGADVSRPVRGAVRDEAGTHRGVARVVA